VPVFFLRLRLTQFMALIQCNVTFYINYASKQRTCTPFYLFSYSGSMVVTPGECNASQLFTLVQSVTINYYCQTIV